MPPEGAGEPLTAEQVGAAPRLDRPGGEVARRRPSRRSGRAADHWSFRPPGRPPLPAVENAGWPRNPIDRFVLARLEKEGLEPSPEADRATLIRRLSLDLIGLPPTLDEVDAFVADARPDAYERLVDRLLASPHYGERWGRHWLDRGPLRRHQRLREGPRALDLALPRLGHPRPQRATCRSTSSPSSRSPATCCPDATLDQLVATGFHRNTMINEEGRHRPRGVPLRRDRRPRRHHGHRLARPDHRCAQCHTHKYDPITQREYYRLFAFLNNADEPEIDVPDPDDRRGGGPRSRPRIAAARSRPRNALSRRRDPDSLEARMAAWEKSLQPGALDRSSSPIEAGLEEARHADRPARRLGAGQRRQAEQRRLRGRAARPT